MSNEHECYICHKRLDLYTRWHKHKPICDNCLIGLIYPQENEQKDQKIAELEKALELACKYIAYAEIVSNPEIANEYTSIDSYKKYQIEHFTSKAKKELNNDR